MYQLGRQSKGFVRLAGWLVQNLSSEPTFRVLRKDQLNRQTVFARQFLGWAAGVL